MNNGSILTSENLRSEAAKLNVSLTDKQAAQIISYSQMLIEYDSHTNLVGNASPECLLYDHILDSLALIPIINRLQLKSGTSSLIDIGSGAGLPGLILAIAKTNLKVTALEATNKKVTFLKSIVDRLDLGKQVKIINGRAEEIAHNKTFRSCFNFATCRALGALPTVCELTLPFLKADGYALLQRGNKHIETEQELAQKAVSVLSAKLTELILLDRNVLGKDRFVMIFEQEKPALFKYPRQWKQIKATPLF